MKELIVMMGFLLLGCVIFDMIAGDGMSLRTASGEKIESMMELYGE